MKYDFRALPRALFLRDKVQFSSGFLRRRIHDLSQSGRDHIRRIRD